MSQEEQDRRIDYVEFPATNLDTAKSFYSRVFGWTFKDWGDDYASFRDGRLEGGFRKETEAQPGGPLVVLYALDLIACKAEVETAGGTIDGEIFEFPGGRRFHFVDPCGNRLAVWSDR